MSNGFSRVSCKKRPNLRYVVQVKLAIYTQRGGKCYLFHLVHLIYSVHFVNLVHLVHLVSLANLILSFPWMVLFGHLVILVYFIHGINLVYLVYPIHLCHLEYMVTLGLPGPHVSHGLLGLLGSPGSAGLIGTSDLSFTRLT